MNFTFTSVSPSLLTVSGDGTVTSVGPLGTGIIRIAAVGTDLQVEFPVEVVFAASPWCPRWTLVAPATPWP